MVRIALVAILLTGFLTARAQSESWQYARLTLATVNGNLRASWVGPDDKAFVQGGILPLAERVMGKAISDTDDAFIVFLNFLGQGGWELTVVLEDASGKRDFLFKRRR